ncbi:kynurenine formamidase [Peribacillus simplex]|nr:kynurenine formamidase [Peribacillus simplex]SNT54017.1 hypothetical protein SAMN05444672_14416 [Bacillus sp. OK838]
MHESMVRYFQHLNESSRYWPGETQYSFWLNSLTEGSSVNVGEIRMSTHLGIHIGCSLSF